MAQRSSLGDKKKMNGRNGLSGPTCLKAGNIFLPKVQGEGDSRPENVY
jgi:hypothetical protein